MRYAVVSAINLAILLAGIALGVMLAPHIEKSVSAQNPVPTSTSHDLTVQPLGPSTTTPAGQKLTPVSAGMTVGSAGIYLLLSHRVQSDQLVVNGYNLLKLQEAELAMMGRFVPNSEIQKVIQDAKAPELYSVGTAQPAPPVTKPPAK